MLIQPLQKESKSGQNNPQKRRSLSFERGLVDSWWVIGVILLSLYFYCHALEKKNSLTAQLKTKVLSLKKERKKALEEKEDLLLRLKSFEDPDWVELVLMEKLGVVPEGQTKAVFQ